MADHDLELVRHISFREVRGARGRTISLPSALPRLPLGQAFAEVTLPLHLHWSGVSRRFDLANRKDRALVYEIVLREGRCADVLTYIDGALLVDVWPDLVLPRDIRAAWDPVIAARA